MMSDHITEQDKVEDNLRQTRSRLDGHLSELQEKLAPSQVVTDLFDYVRGHGGQEFARNLIGSAAKNPLPAVIAGVGLAWLIAANFRNPASTTTGYDYGRKNAGLNDTDLERRGRAAEVNVMAMPDETE